MGITSYATYVFCFENFLKHEKSLYALLFQKKCIGRIGIIGFAKCYTHFAQMLYPFCQKSQNVIPFFESVIPFFSASCIGSCIGFLENVIPFFKCYTLFAQMLYPFWKRYTHRYTHFRKRYTHRYTHDFQSKPSK